MKRRFLSKPHLYEEEDNTSLSAINFVERAEK